MNLGDLKRYKFLKASKPNFFMIAPLSFYNGCLESNNDDYNNNK